MLYYFKNTGGDAMEFVMNKIMSIDKDAEGYRKGIDDLLEEKQNELENEIKDMLASFEEEVKTIKEGISHEKIIEAEYRARNIRKEKEAQINSINTKYEDNKLEIINEVINYILEGKTPTY